MFNIVYYPEFLIKFFNEYSDKTQFLKGAEIAIFFIVVTFFANKFSEGGPLVDLFVLMSSIYIPLIFFKSSQCYCFICLYHCYDLQKKKYFLKILKDHLFYF